jgi:hypothetical protein
MSRTIHQRVARRALEKATDTSPTSREHTNQSGRPLPPAVAQSMESGFGHSFANVRVHDGAEGDQTARDFGARAVAMGKELFFRDGAFAPETAFGSHVLAHELAHVIQQTSSEPRSNEFEQAVANTDAPEGPPEHEARDAAATVSSGGSARVVAGSVVAGTAQLWPWDDDDPAKPPASGADGGILSSLGSMASGAWDATKSAAGAGYDAYQKSTDFKPVAAGEGSKIDWGGSKPISLTQALGAGVDWYEKSAQDSSKKMEASAAGIPVLEQLAQASGFLNTTTANITGGVVRGVGDLAGGVANAFFHPIDAASGIEGIMEHNSTIPFLSSTLKAAHGAYDIASGNDKGEYGSSWGDLASHILDPRKQAEDDAKFDSNLARGILAPGTKDWGDAYGKLKENPADMLARAGTNVAPMLLGAGELEGGEGAADVANAEPKAVPVSDPPPTLRTPYAPPGVPIPKPFNPDIPIVGPGDSPPVINPGGGPVVINPNHPFYPNAGAPTVPVPELPPDTIPGGPQFPKLPGEPIAPDPIPKLPGGPKEGPPIPREDPISVPGDTLRQPIDIPGVPAEEPLPSTKPRPSTIPDGPITQDAPASQGSAVPTERGLGGLPAIPRGMDPGALIQLLIDTPGGKSVTELMRELGMPIEHR